MSKPCTHYIEYYPESTEETPVQTPQGVRMREQTRPSMRRLIRASDGMVLGVCQGDAVKIGADPDKATVRLFMDEKYADAYLRKFADEDRRETEPDSAGAVIEEIDKTDVVRRATRIAQPNLGDIARISNGR